MESQNVTLPMPAFLYSDKTKKLLKQIKNPILKHMVRVWNDVRKYLNESTCLSQFSPVWGNQLFTPGRADATLKLWASRGPKTISVLYPSQSDIFMTFRELQLRFKKKQYFNYLQLRSFVKTKQGCLNKIPHTQLKNCFKKIS